MKWEYTVRPIKIREGDDHFELLIKYLNLQGDNGWELVSINNGIAYFKRPIQEEIPVYKDSVKLDFPYKRVYDD